MINGGPHCVLYGEDFIHKRVRQRQPCNSRAAQLQKLQVSAISSLSGTRQKSNAFCATPEYNSLYYCYWHDTHVAWGIVLICTLSDCKLRSVNLQRKRYSTIHTIQYKVVLPDRDSTAWVKKHSHVHLNVASIYGDLISRS